MVADINGKEIVEGDNVVFTDYINNAPVLSTGYVHKITEKTIICISNKNFRRTIQKHKSNLTIMVL